MGKLGTRSLALGITVVLAATGLASCDLLAPEQQLAVTTTVDGSDADPGDGVCEMTVGAEDCSLRAAIDEANANAAIVFVDVPPGTYELAGLGDPSDPPVGLEADPASGKLFVGGTGLGVVVDANGAPGGIDAVSGNVVTFGVSVTGSGGAGFTARPGADLQVIAGSPHLNAGAGVHFASGSTGRVVSSTVSANGAGVVADGVASVTSSTITDNGGPGLSGSGTSRVTASIVVRQASAPDCAAPVATQGWNIFGDGACGGGSSDVLDPGLELVPQTVAGVPAFVAAAAEAAVRDVIPLTAGACSIGASADQAGAARPQGSGCDIGAVEGEAPPITLVVDSPNDAHDADPDDGVCNDGTGACTLRAAIDEANVQGGATAASFLPVTISIAAGVNPQLEWFNSESLVIAGGVTIEGGGATIDLGQSEQLFVVLHHYLEVHDLTFTNGTFPADPVISNQGTGASGASITLDHVTIEGEDETFLFRGFTGVGMNGGDLTVLDSTIVGGRGRYLEGSGLGSVLIERSRFGSEDGMSLSGHEVDVRDSVIGTGLGAGLTADATGHVLVERTTVTFSGGLGVGGPFTVRDSTFVRNDGGLFVYPTGTGTVERSTFTASNVPTPYTGGGYADIRVYAGGSATVTGNIFAGPTVASFPGLPTYDVCPATTGTLVSGGYNVVADTSCGFAATGDVEGVAVGLNPPADNGGFTETLLPTPTSPALERIPFGSPGLCDASSPVDQRGIARPQGTHCDSGAVERTASDPS